MRRCCLREHKLVVKRDELLLQHFKVFERILCDEARVVRLQTDSEEDERIALIDHDMLTYTAAQFSHGHETLDELPYIKLSLSGFCSH